jgi:hypothetical protein
MHGANDAFAFFHKDYMVRLGIFELFDLAAGPTDFKRSYPARFSGYNAPQVILRQTSSAA